MEVWSVIWLILAIAFVVFEAATVQLLSIWFAAGALVAMLVCRLGGAVWLQLLVFFVVSIALFALLWPMARRNLKRKIVATNTDALVGRICFVTEDIVNAVDGGRVKVGDVTWSALSENGEPIAAGEQVPLHANYNKDLIVIQQRSGC